MKARPPASWGRPPLSAPGDGELVKSCSSRLGGLTRRGDHRLPGIYLQPPEKERCEAREEAGKKIGPSSRFDRCSRP